MSSVSSNISSTRCDTCSKKLTLTQQTMLCKCGKCFCNIHRAAETHFCTFDFKAYGVPKLEKELFSAKSVPEKIQSTI
jgi:hypothetical protein